MEKTLQYKLIVSDRSRRMLAGYVRFIAQKNPSGARKVKNELMDAIRSLKEIPERFLVFGGRIYPAQQIS